MLFFFVASSLALENFLLLLLVAPGFVFTLENTLNENRKNIRVTMLIRTPIYASFNRTFSKDMANDEIVNALCNQKAKKVSDYSAFTFRFYISNVSFLHNHTP